MAEVIVNHDSTQELPFDQEALIRSLGVSRNHILLLGAGASASSGIPTASQIVFELKRDIFLSKNPTTPPGTVSDVSLPLVRRRLQAWFDSQGGFPTENSPEEYGFYLEYAFPRDSDRARFFSQRFAGAVPQIGFQLLSILQNRGHFHWIFTTNFDGLIRQARRPSHTRPLKEIGLDTTFRLEAADDQDAAYVVYLHGDYRYDRLLNSSEETRELDQALRERLKAAVSSSRLVVIGYSGRDNSVMEALESATLSGAEGGGLLWCCRRGSVISGRVSTLINEAKSRGFDANLVAIENFDDLMVRSARYVCREGADLRDVELLLGTIEPLRSVLDLPNYFLTDSRIISNGVGLVLPREIYRFISKDIASWKQLRELTKGKEVYAGLLRGEVLAVGDIDVIKEVFAANSASQIVRGPVSDVDLNSQNSVTLHLFLSAIRHSLATYSDLAFDDDMIWDPTFVTSEKVDSSTIKVERAVRLAVRRELDHDFLLFVPELRLSDEDGNRPSRLISQEVKRRAFATQYNRVYYAEIERWLTRFIGADQSRQFSFPPSGQSQFKFRITRPWAGGRILARERAHPTAPSLAATEAFVGPLLPEPVLNFAPVVEGAKSRDIHPLRGVMKFGPYDSDLTSMGLNREVKLGVICPTGYETRLLVFLQALTQPHERVETNSDYLLPYPGFARVYRLPLIVPNPADVEWGQLPDLEELDTGSPVDNQRKVTDAVNRQIESLIARTAVDVIVILVPGAWEPFDRVEDEEVRFDLHDFIKAYAAQRGVRTQLLREETLQDPQRCAILWWLSEALYVKAARTPYVLESQDPGTVFVGIGYGIPKGRGESGVVFGCSHLYSSSGLGLKFQLSKVDQPIWQQARPYLSKEDAVRIGLQTRQLFYESYQKLPNRVVFHKRTRFTRDEREGLAQALKGVTELEMLTVEYDEAWRFLKYDSRNARPHPFPVRRGTVMQTGPYEFLLWLHGAVRGLSDPTRSYYQGKSRIPTPLRVTRHSGNSPIERIAAELLGLSKMDWNSFDLYTKVPATLKSPQIIARVGQLLSQIGPEAYDYRLFM